LKDRRRRRRRRRVRYCLLTTKNSNEISSKIFNKPIHK